MIWFRSLTSAEQESRGRLYTVTLTLRKYGKQMLPPRTITTYYRNINMLEEHSYSITGEIAELKHMLLEVTDLELTSWIYRLWLG